jgi:2-polyprenyl-6-methoxyphenol hydroxylase-like FAD-dependent oxidoreductase
MPDHNIVIVGGGPIGLMTAVSLKALLPEASVKTYEKYPEYQRKHTLNMKSDKHQALLRTIEASEITELSALQKRLEADPHIRTNEIETIYKQLEQKLGASIEYKEMQSADLDSLLTSEKPITLLIGADGTHGIVNQHLFPVGNQSKYEFDFVLQLRFEIEGSERAAKMPGTTFFQTMMQNRTIANEYVGYYDHEKKRTPVTMQMMISKDDFIALQSATSKHPYFPFAKSKVEKFEEEKKSAESCTVQQLPQHISHFVSEYLANKLEYLHKQNKNHAEIFRIDTDSVRISVNEAPATSVKQVTCLWHGIPVLLMGDASLGLSYFKGLNAGIEAITKLMSLLKPNLATLDQPGVLQSTLQAYQKWFLQDFAPRKVKEVEKYSFYRIRAAMSAISFVDDLRYSSSPYPAMPVGHEFMLYNYFHLFGEKGADYKGIENGAVFYPHRAYSPVRFGDLAPCYQHTGQKIGKLFLDYGKPYKSKNHFYQDLLQPMKGLGHLVLGSVKLLGGVVTLNRRSLADGAVTLGLSALEIATTPFAWTIKPLARGLSSSVKKEKSFIEYNRGMGALSTLGLRCLTEYGVRVLTPQELYLVLAISNDIHRKFTKCELRGQKTKIKLDELLLFSSLHKAVYDNKNDQSRSLGLMKNYFMLFGKKKDLVESLEVNPDKNKKLKM